MAFRLRDIYVPGQRAQGGIVGARIPLTYRSPVPRQQGLGPGYGDIYDWNRQRMLEEEAAMEKLAPILADLQMQRERLAADAARQAADQGYDWLSGWRELQYRGLESDAERAARAALLERELGFRGQESALGREHDIRTMRLGEELTQQRMGLAQDYDIERLAYQQGFAADQATLDRQQREQLQRLGHTQDLERMGVQDRYQTARDARLNEYDVERAKLLQQFGIDTLDHQSMLQARRDGRMAAFDREDRLLQQRLGLEQMDVQQRYNLERMGVGQQYDLDRMDLANRQYRERDTTEFGRQQFLMGQQWDNQRMMDEMRVADELYQSGRAAMSDAQQKRFNALRNAISEVRKNGRIGPEDTERTVQELRAQMVYEYTHPELTMPSERDTPLDQAFQSGVYWHEGTPWVRDNNGMLQVARGWTPPPSPAEMAQRETENQQKLIDEVQKKRWEFLKWAMSQKNDEGNYEYSMDRAEREAASRYPMPGEAARPEGMSSGMAGMIQSMANALPPGAERDQVMERLQGMSGSQFTPSASAPLPTGGTPLMVPPGGAPLPAPNVSSLDNVMYSAHREGRSDVAAAASVLRRLGELFPEAESENDLPPEYRQMYREADRLYKEYTGGR